MLFGSIQTFAIEAMVEPELVPPSAVWGRMRVWCQSVPIGDFAEPWCALFPAYQNFKSLQAELSYLWESEFADLTDLQLWNRLDGLLFNFHGDIEVVDDRTVSRCADDWERYGRFSFLTNWGEGFDADGKSFIVCTPAGKVRILNRTLPAACGLSLQAPLPCVSEAIAGFLLWFEQEAKRLLPSGS